MSKGNEPAFASVWKPSEQQAHWGHKEVMHSGLTKREYFAGLAMQGILSDEGVLREQLVGEPDHLTVAQVVAKESVVFADALLAELEKTA